jgi:two-component system, OmpR family, response regulator
VRALLDWESAQPPVQALRLLIAEDDPILAEALVESLRGSGYAVDRVADGAEADAALAAMSFDLVILDLDLPRMTGLNVLKRLRARKSSVPVLILTVLDSVEDRVKGLDLGADDYLAKPFDLPELEARVRALTRRARHGGQAIVEIGTLAYDPRDRTVTVAGEPVELSARELGVLEILLTRSGRFVSKDQIVDHLCQWGEEITANAVEVYVYRLRKKIESGGVRISTLRGLGYTLQAGAAGDPA